VQPRFHRGAPLAEAEQCDVCVLIGQLRQGLEEPERLRELAMGAERSQLRARVRGGGGGRGRRDRRVGERAAREGHLRSSPAPSSCSVSIPAPPRSSLSP
jgi:hypothetical protein